MGQAESCLISSLAYTNTDLISLAGVHHTFHIVVPCMNLTLDNRLEVRLHLCSRHLYIGSQREGLTLLQLVQLLAYNGNLVILNLICIAGLYQLAGGRLMGTELYLHIASTDNLALECGSESNRNRKLGYLNLNVTQLQGLLHGQAVIQNRLQRARNLILAQIHVYDYREAQRDSACACGYNHLVQSAEGIHECRYSFLGVF